jgi:hypothetical protein
MLRAPRTSEFDMRPIVAATLLALTATACKHEKPAPWDEYPGSNVATDLRGGQYTKNEGYGPLPISQPPTVNRSVADAPFVEHPAAVNPLHPDVTPIAATRLASMLPGAPKGWAAEEANATRVLTERGEVSEARRNYVGSAPKGDKEGTPSIEVSIVDRGQAGPEVAAPSDEKRGVKVKNVQVAGQSATEFEAGPGLRQLDFEVSDRYFVRVRGVHVSAQELESWASRVNLSPLGGKPAKKADTANTSPEPSSTTEPAAPSAPL